MIFQKNTFWTCYLVNILLFLGAGYLIVDLLNNYDLVYQSLSARLDEPRIREIFAFRERLGYWALALIPLVLILKYLLISAPLIIGKLLENIQVKAKEILRIVALYDFVFVFPLLIKVAWFTFFHTGYTMRELQVFYPLSIASWIGYDRIETCFLYPLQATNVFEFLYIIALVVSLKKYFSGSFLESAFFVFKFYVLPQLIWHCLIIFLSLL